MDLQPKAFGGGIGVSEVPIVCDEDVGATLQ
jgi:hypothetical protein